MLKVKCIINISLTFKNSANSGFYSVGMCAVEVL